MDEIRRTIMDKFLDEKSCDMFKTVLLEKWSSFKGDLKRKCTVKIVRDSNEPWCMSAVFVFEHLNDFLLISDWAEEEIIPFRDTLSPATQNFSGVIEAKFEFM